jgi:hypothetical protein
VASALEAAGLPMGERLLQEFPGNPRGHFEDLDFVELHDAALAAFPEGAFQAELRPLCFDAGQRQRAAELVARRQALPAWGFKDPRATLFLDEWAALLADPGFLLLYRHPLEVVASIVRRGIDPDVLARPATGLAIWDVHAEHVLRCRLERPARTLLLPLDGITADLPGFVQRVADRFGLVLDARPAGQRWHAEELRRAPLGPRSRALFARGFARSAGLLAELDRVADLPSPTGDDRDPAGIEALEVLAAEPGFPLLEGLLVLLAPEAWTKVDGRRRELGRRARELERESEQRRQHILRVEAYVRDLEARVADLEAHVGNLEHHGEAHAGNQQEQLERQVAYIASLEETRDRLWSDLQRVGKAWEEQQQRIEALEKRLQRRWFR